MPLELYDLASAPFLLPSSGNTMSTQVFLAQIRRPNGEWRKVHLKVLPKKALAVELLVAELAKQLGLNVQKCFLVRVSQDQAPLFVHSLCYRQYKFHGDFVVLGRELPKHPTLAHVLVREKAEERLLAFVRRIVNLEAAGVFDEWIANENRTYSNIMLAGTHSWWLGDHDMAFAGGKLRRLNLVADRAYKNALGDWLLAPPLASKTVQTWEKVASETASKASKCRPQEMVSDMSQFNFLAAKEETLLSEFLKQRAGSLVSLIHCRLKNAAMKSSLALPPQNTSQLPIPFPEAPTS